MNRNALANAAPQLIFGAFIIIVGSLFLLDNLRIIDAGNFSDYWPSFFVIIGLIRLAQAESNAGRFIGFFIALIGLLWILQNLDLITFSLVDYWPVALVAAGIALIWKTLGRAARAPSGAAPDGTPGTGPSAYVGTDVVNGVAVLGAFRRAINSQDFRGGTLTAFMGGCEIDLREASISSGEVVIDTMAVWGGIEIKVPQDWLVEMRGMPILGGMEDKTKPARDSSKRLVVKGMAIMGGVEIRN
jgi:predicted membrane protein